jgi:hypothetical protein
VQSGIFTLCALLLLSAPADAELIDIGNGLIYDTLQDLTWTQDPMLARTSGFDTDGRMTYATAVTWVEALSFAGLSDWRLPAMFAWSETLPKPEHSGSFGDSELSRLLRQLGWQWSAHNAPDYLAGTIGPFTGIASTFFVANPIEQQSCRPGCYWWAWATDIDVRDSDLSRAWAVRSGRPTAVPTPGTLTLVGLGLLVGLTLLRRSQREFETSQQTERGRCDG